MAPRQWRKVAMLMQGGPMTADDADAMVRVTYTFSPLFAALEPALLVGAFTALFLMWLAASHMDFTSVKGREWHAKQVCGSVLYYHYSCCLCFCPVSSQFQVAGLSKTLMFASPENNA